MLKEPDLIIRASSLSEYFDCSERWRQKYLLGKRLPSGAAAAIGTAVHKGTAVFDTQRLEGSQASVDDAVEAAAESVRNPDDEVNWDDVRPNEAATIAGRLTMNYCLDIAPQFKYRKVEMKLDALDIQATNGVLMRITGHVDRQYIEERSYEGVVDQHYGTLDFKTGKQVVASDGTVKVSVSAAQLGTYELLELMASKTESVPHILPAMIVAMPTAGKQTPKVVRIDNPHKMLVGDEHNKGLLDIAADIYKHDLFVGNPRSILCNVKYCPAFDSCRWRMQGDIA